MITRIAHVTIVVRDQEEALRFYTEKLGFEKRDDQRMGEFRWLTVGPAQQPDLAVVLHRPAPPMHTPEEAEAILAKVGDNPMWVLASDDCHGDYERLRGNGVKFVSVPESKPWGISAVFEDLYGNRFNLLQPTGVPS